jgi:dihydrodipicolinate synthase/N-acetylneuraminate lyase
MAAVNEPDTRGILDRRGFLRSAGAIAVTLGVARSLDAVAKASSGRTLQGLFPIGETPFTPDNVLDLDGLAAEVKFCSRGGVPGFVWPQIASGWSTLSEKERLDGAEAILSAAKGGRTAVVIGVQAIGGDMDTTLRYVKHATEHGADAIISLPPEKVDEQAMLEYYKAIGAATPLPLFVQTLGDMSVDLIVKMYQQIPTMKVVKDEAGNPLERVVPILERTDHKIAVFAGQGVRTMLDEMQRGFTGFCPLPGLADVFQKAWELWEAGRKREAFDMFGRVLAFDSIQGATQYTMIARGVFKEDTTRRPTPGMGAGRPQPKLDDTQKRVIREAFDTYLKPHVHA